MFGSYAKGTENEDSDIDIAVISDDFEDIYDCMAVLMGMTWDIDARIEPHPITTEDFEKIILKEDEYFIMGDNRLISLDSRRIGAITKDQIEGVTDFILFPFSKFGTQYSF